MHDKKKYNNKTSYSIQGLRPLSKSLPHGLKKILKKGGHNYSSIINNWSDLVGKKIASACYPKSIKTGKELKNGVLFINVSHGDQILVEYSKKDIIDKINSFFGYEFVKEIRLVLVRDKINQKNENDLNNKKHSIYYKKIENIQNSQLKKNLSDLINVFNIKKKSK
tara:strand:+ start:177 stop:674 length:498 start_codon:yes stop_codon:yes gene_type:complete